MPLHRREMVGLCALIMAESGIMCSVSKKKGTEERECRLHRTCKEFRLYSGDNVTSLEDFEECYLYFKYVSLIVDQKSVRNG